MLNDCTNCKHGDIFANECPCRGCLFVPNHPNWEPVTVQSDQSKDDLEHMTQSRDNQTQLLDAMRERAETAEAERDALKQRLDHIEKLQSELRVVIIGGTGYYVTEAVKAHIELLQAVAGTVVEAEPTDAVGELKVHSDGQPVMWLQEAARTALGGRDVP